VFNLSGKRIIPGLIDIYAQLVGDSKKKCMNDVRDFSFRNHCINLLPDTIHQYITDRFSGYN
jgi:hypothetical protein